MKSDFWLDQIPLWGVFLLMVFGVLLSVAAGCIWGKHRARKPERQAEASEGVIITASLGLLAFMLAITFGTTAQFLQIRRQLLLAEVNAIGTTYLRTRLLAEPRGGDLRSLLREYVAVRLKIAGEELVHDPEKLKEQVAYSEALLSQMWRHAAALERDSRNPEIEALFIQSLNDVIDLKTSRWTVFHYRLPPIIWYVLFVITVLSMMMVGYRKGLSGRRGMGMEILLALNFSLVVLLIADLDRVSEGSFRSRERPLYELQKQMQESEETSFSFLKGSREAAVHRDHKHGRSAACCLGYGVIARSRRPDAVGLFRKVMPASASIPGAFPSVLMPRTGFGLPKACVITEG